MKKRIITALAIVATIVISFIAGTLFTTQQPVQATNKTTVDLEDVTYWELTEDDKVQLYFADGTDIIMWQ